MNMPLACSTRLIGCCEQHGPQAQLSQFTRLTIPVGGPPAVHAAGRHGGHSEVGHIRNAGQRLASAGVRRQVM